MSDDENSEKVSSGNAYPIRSAIDLQRMKLEKLMKNPLKPAFIPESTREKKFPDAPEFVRNVMGSSAGAGSGEFHVYRHIRRREYSRDIYLQKCKEKAKLDDEYDSKIEENKRIAEEKTAKKRKKRQKRKESIRNKRKKGNVKNEDSSSESDGENEDKECEDTKPDVGKSSNKKLQLLKQTLEAQNL